MWQVDPQPQRSWATWAALVAALPAVGFAWLVAVPFVIAGALHAGGHLVAARVLGVPLDRVSAGWGVPLFSARSAVGRWQVALLPGAFVTPDQAAFEALPGSSQIGYHLAGLGASLLGATALPIGLVALSLLTTGVIEGDPVVGHVAPASDAEGAGWQPHDRIVRVGSSEVSTWHQVIDAAAGGPQVALVKRDRRELALDLHLDPDQTLEAWGLNPWILSTQVGVLTYDLPAGRAGLRTGDTIEAIDGEPVQRLADLCPALTQRPHRVTVIRPPGERHVLTVDPPPARGDTPPECTLAAWGLVSGTLAIEEVAAGSPAEEAGLRARDVLLQVAGQPIGTWEELTDHVAQAGAAGRRLSLDFVRDGELSFASAEPKRVPMEGTERWVLGVYRLEDSVLPGPTHIVTPSPGVAIARAAATWRDAVVGMLPSRRPATVQGPIAILANGTVPVGYIAATWLGGANLWVLLANLLPIPLGDGWGLLDWAARRGLGRSLRTHRLEAAAWLLAMAIALFVWVAL